MCSVFYSVILITLLNVNDVPVFKSEVKLHLSAFCNSVSSIVFYDVLMQLVGLTEVEVNSAEDIMRYFIEGSQSRTVGSTAMNNQSSRSHAIFTLNIERKNRNDR